MRQYRTEFVETTKLEKIICNKCGREIPVHQGVPCEDVLEVEKHWGYFSAKDGQVDSFALCEKCYDELVAGFQIKPENEH
jgi:Fe2+ or Zn2+ uptake regulation protein